MDLRARIDALNEDAPPSPDPEHARADAVLRALAAEELETVEEVLDRWEEAGHPRGSVPAAEDLEPSDTGILVDPDSMTLIATPAEWEVFERVTRQLR